MANSDLFEKGLKKRRQVFGERYVDANLAASDDFMMTFQRAVTELAWGYAWSRPENPESFDAWNSRGPRSLSRA
jgi:4-carboxymuconolactone decarboxylase